MTTDDHPDQSQIVQKIHADFRNSHIIIIDSLKDELKELSKLKELEDQIKNAEKLRKLGFIQAKGSELEQSELEKRKKAFEERQKLLSTIIGYTVKYPNYKYISESEVRRLCHKYNLVCGNVFRYTGEIPETNMAEIFRFKELVDERDIPEGKLIADNLLDRLPKYEMINLHRNLEENEYKRGTYSSTSLTYQEGPMPMKICAPVQYMDMVGVRVTDNYKMESSNPVKHTDPVVLQPVHEGYLIITAWGNEASDQLVVNPILN